MSKKTLKIIIPFLVILISTVGFLWITDHFSLGFNYQLKNNSNDIHNITTINDAAIIILTFIIACIAWYQLKGLINTGRAEFLLEIDKRYGGDPAILEARKIIHSIYIKVKKKHPQASEEEYSQYMAEEICKLGDSKSKKGGIEYVYLLNFMDFLETISLFTNRNHVDIDDIKDLMNQSLEFFYTIFHLRIKERRRKYKDESFYSEFETLTRKLKCKKARITCCPFCRNFCFDCLFNTH